MAARAVLSYNGKIGKLEPRRVGPVGAENSDSSTFTGQQFPTLKRRAFCNPRGFDGELIIATAVRGRPFTANRL